MHIEEEKFKYKKLSKTEIDVSLKRLRRFKYSPDKKQRVYKQILTKCTIEPKISTKIFNNLKKAQIDRLFQIIWNSSCEGQKNVDFWSDDVRCFNSKRMLEDIFGVSLSGEFDAKTLNNLLKENGYKCLKKACNYDDFYIGVNEQFPLNMPEGTMVPRINKIVLVEGATEEILLPKFAQKLGADFDKEGILIIAAGGKNQVAKAYLEQKYVLKLPIIVLLDADAQEQADDIKKVIREQDKIYLIKNGEFEDVLCKKLILKALNKEFKNVGNVSYSDLNVDFPMTTILYELYKEKGFGDFKKVEFAKIIQNNIKNESDVSDELKEIFNSFL